MTSPGAVLLGGLGVAVAIVAGAPVAAAAAVGAVCYGARVALAIPRRRRPPRIEPGRLREPWRSFVVDAVQAQQRFRQTAASCAPGPLRTQLESISTRLDDGVQECMRVARQGDLLDQARSRLDIGSVERELAGVQAEQASRRANGADAGALDATRQSIAAQLSAAKRIERGAVEARDRLRLLNAQLDEAGAAAVELTVRPFDQAALTPLSGQVDGIVSELESLRAALEDLGGSPPPAAAAGPAPTT